MKNPLDESRRQAAEARRELGGITRHAAAKLTAYLSARRAVLLEELAIADENVQLWKGKGRIHEVTELLQELEKHLVSSPN